MATKYLPGDLFLLGLQEHYPNSIYGRGWGNFAPPRENTGTKMG